MRPIIRKLISCAAAAFLISVLLHLPASGQTVDLRTEYASVLEELVTALRNRQILDSEVPDCGAIRCELCGVLHTRAAEALYPFAVHARISGNREFLRASALAGNWLVQQQQENGSWKETPEEWTGTTVDQSLMMSLGFPILQGTLTAAERSRWCLAIEKSADYICRVITPEFASINYVATAAAALAAANRVLPRELYLQKARELAHRTVAKMNADGFVEGEGGRSHGVKMGVDLGYDLEMSLWGLAYYARVVGDTLVAGAVRSSLSTHLNFIYPDGSLDNSWGIRSNKWTTYGGVTSDGCQALFSLFSGEDPGYVSAASRNLQYLRKNMKDGIVGYGPHHWEVFATPPCIYPTFTKAKNLALAHEIEREGALLSHSLPSDSIPFLRTFKTVDVALVRTGNFMATVTAYRYKDQGLRSKSKYMYRPSGGAISNLWVEGHGFLQASSVTIYSRPEPMTFPEAPGIRSLTPRIEYSDSAGYFTNLFDFDARMESHVDLTRPGVYEVTAEGELKDKEWLVGGVGYSVRYHFAGDFLEKTVTLRYHDARPEVTIVEPVIDNTGMTFEQPENGRVLIRSTGKSFEIKLIAGEARIVLGRDRERYWAPFPALRAYPIELLVAPPAEGHEQRLIYRISLVEGLPPPGK